MIFRINVAYYTTQGNNTYNVCVRIHNNKSIASTGTETLYLNWAKAGLDLRWPNNWNGENFFNCGGNKVPKGGYIGNIAGDTIPSIAADIC